HIIESHPPGRNILGHNIIQHKTTNYRRINHPAEQRNTTVVLVMVFALAAVAAGTHVSIMLAGFAAGLALAGIGEPRRVARQLFAVTEGFLAPLFFIWLGAQLNLREFADRPKLIGLGLALGLCAVAAHALMRLSGQPIMLGALAATQIGVPVAAVTVGTQLHVLQKGEGAAMMLGALVTIASAVAVSAVATARSPAR
ncbi:MAG: cation:proton antiporter, partial [Nocardia sp.]|nr:cation:proton antiporter [Nocardia sp.]